MKRIITLFLSIMICMAALAACGDTQNTESGFQDASGEVTVEEQTIFDDQGIKAVVKGYGKYENDLISFDRELLIDVTNNTDKTISFGLNHCSVNGYMVESYYFTPVEAGRTETCPAVFNSPILESLTATAIADYGFCIVIQDNETLETLIESDPISVKTSAYKGFEYKFDESGTVLYDADGVKIIARERVEDEFVGPCVKFYIANDTDKNIIVSIVSGIVNGKKVKDLFFGAETSAGKHSIELMSIGEEERPDKIESLTLRFSIADRDTGDLIVEKSEPASVSF